MPTQREIWEQWKAPETLEDNVKFMFEMLDKVETSDSGRDFHPNTFSSCRVWDTHRLNKVFKKMKELANYPHSD
jgi:hypothetical protein